MSFYQQAKSAAINNVVAYKHLTDPAYWMERAECAARELVSDLHAGRKHCVAGDANTLPNAYSPPNITAVKCRCYQPSSSRNT